jgi:hypothetical protein
MLDWALGGVLLAAGGCWPEVTLANRKSEIRTTIRSRITKSPIVGVLLLLTLSQERCFSKGNGITGDYRGNTESTDKCIDVWRGLEFLIHLSA